MTSKLTITIIGALAAVLGGTQPGSAGVLFQDGFETAWSGDYAPGWVNAAYRHGPAPVGQMMQQTTTAKSGTHGLKLIADSTPESWMWWASVEVGSLPAAAMLKQYDPYVSAWYYDETTASGAGQIYAVPSWVNPYIAPGEDWTDIQFGERFNTQDNYYYVAAGENSPGWQSTGVARSEGWHNLKMQLSSLDGKVHFYIDGTEVGTSYRNDYTDLGTAIGLYTMFQAPLSSFGDDKPYTLWDDFEVGSAVPEPTTIITGALLMIPFGIASIRTVRKRRSM